LSRPRPQTVARMRTLRILITGQAGPRVIARFGNATLVRGADRRYALVGGTEAEAAEAREWTAHFLHEAAFPRRLTGCRR